MISKTCVNFYPTLRLIYGLTRRINFILMILSLKLLTQLALGSENDTSVEQIKKRKSLRVGLESVLGSKNVFSYRNPKSGEFEGLEIELAKHIATSLDVPLKIVPTKWDRIPQEVREGQIDLGIQQIFISPDTPEYANLLFSDPYFRMGIGVAVSKDDAMQSIEDLKKKSGAIFKDPKVIEYIKTEKYKDIRIFDSETTLYGSLTKKKVSFIAYDFALLATFVENNPEKVRIFTKALPGSEGSYGVLLKKDAKSLLNTVNAVIEAWLKKPSSQAIIERYGIPITNK